MLSIEKHELQLPTLEQILNKQKEIINLLNYKYSAKEIEEIVSKKIEAKLQNFDFENLPERNYNQEIDYLHQKVTSLELKQIETLTKDPQIDLLKYRLEKLKL